MRESRVVVLVGRHLRLTLGQPSACGCDTWARGLTWQDGVQEEEGDRDNIEGGQQRLQTPCTTGLRPYANASGIGH
jgi:hypothetical protein